LKTLLIYTNKFINLKNILIIIAILYTYFYLSNPALPGNNLANPLGWWGWFDQGEYLKGVKAFATHNYSIHNFFYPPLYTLLGSLFYKFLPNHFYFFIDLFSLLILIYFFVKLAENFIGEKWAIVIVFFGLFSKYIVFVQYVIPWTTTPTAALISIALYYLYKINISIDIKPKYFFLYQFIFVISTSLVIPLRPLDSAIVFISLYPFYIYTVFKHMMYFKNKLIYFYSLLINLLGGSIGLIILFGFNYFIYKDIWGGYLSHSSDLGFSFFNFPFIFYKFNTFFIDSYNLNFISNGTFLENFPWLYLSLFSMFYFVFFGKFIIKVISTLIIIYFIMYLPFHDLLINGLWKYLNIHYFKWLFPYAAFLAFYFILIVYKQYKSKKYKVIAISFSLLTVFILLLQYQFKINYIKKSSYILETPNSISIYNSSSKKIDGIDFYGISNSFNDIYFGNQRIVLDNKKILKRVKDFRIIPAPFGMRLLFINPQNSKQLKIVLNKTLNLSGLQNISLFNYSYTYFQKKVKFSNYKIGEAIKFYNQNSRQYIISGFSGVETFGSWSDAKEAIVEIRPFKTLYSNITLVIEMGAFLDKYGKQNVNLFVNDFKLHHFEFNENNYQFKRYSFVINKNILTRNMVNLKFEIGNPTSPLEKNMNNDTRELGISLKLIKIIKAQK